MSGFADLFTSMNFKGTVQKYCAQQGWKIADIDDKHAVLRFTMNSGRNQTLYIIRYDSTLEFSVPSLAAFDSEDQIPHYLSTILLKRSSQRKIGFWCIEQIGGKQVYSCMHNAEMKLIDADYFAQIVRVLVNECDDFEDTLLKMLNS